MPTATVICGVVQLNQIGVAMSRFETDLIDAASFWDEPILIDAANRLQKLENFVGQLKKIVNPQTYGAAIGGYQYMFGQIDNLLKEIES